MTYRHSKYDQLSFTFERDCEHGHALLRHAEHRDVERLVGPWLRWFERLHRDRAIGAELFRWRELKAIRFRHETDRSKQRRLAGLDADRHLVEQSVVALDDAKVRHVPIGQRAGQLRADRKFARLRARRCANNTTHEQRNQVEERRKTSKFPPRQSLGRTTKLREKTDPYRIVPNRCTLDLESPDCIRSPDCRYTCR